MNKKVPRWHPYWKIPYIYILSQFIKDILISRNFIVYTTHQNTLTMTHKEQTIQKISFHMLFFKGWESTTCFWGYIYYIYLFTRNSILFISRLYFVLNRRNPSFVSKLQGSIDFLVRFWIFWMKISQWHCRFRTNKWSND